MRKSISQTSLDNLNLSNRYYRGVKKITLSLQPETIKLLKHTGNASETVEKLVKALKTGVLQWHVLNALERH
jgi:hypothetical protein